jgi:hypothetical protein
MSAQQPRPAAERAVAAALKDVWARVEQAVQRAGRDAPVGAYARAGRSRAAFAQV